MTEPQPAAVPAALRRERMLDLIGRHGFVRVGDLSEAFQVSDVTVRSDLDLLDQQQSIRRVHGGAVLRTAGAMREPSFEEALESSADEKRSIGIAAAARVESGTSVLLDVGTTTTAIARALVDREDLDGVTVITNGLTIALELERAIPRFQVVVTGGTLRPLQHSLVEPLASVLLDRMHADLAFVGCTGVDAAGGITNVNLPEADLKRVMVGAATRVVVVADGSKVGRIHLGRIADVDEVHELITGASADRDGVAALRTAGLQVLVA